MSGEFLKSLAAFITAVFGEFFGLWSFAVVVTLCCTVGGMRDCNNRARIERECIHARGEVVERRGGSWCSFARGPTP